ncbi:type III secretion system export apparatus subunit SctV [Algicola sagamiensis]|uniref:type III secretion system export apparatus subunit SctV n=1 Tax=Algicola sagamiensis TaxID=163869 RepID=UPI000364608E|nr:type III secretion system export apparatus subunit SctV [Algicola sagamiensis]
MSLQVVNSFASRLSQRKDIILAILLIAIVFMMILPLPTALVDVLIGTNMGLSVILLMLAVYITTPLEFSSFPAVLLLTTLFRLALSITTTRLILLQADAGQIVTTFGNFVVGGNLIVGIVIFLIITIVQFLVITKGSERVAEVSARFSLDAMPGKQMSIDGDMRAGVIDMEEARKRRNVIEKESQLYGSMDGAMKFVKGDAIAGLIIILVNIIGGISIGITQRGLSAGEALEIYTILTIGDGLISQIPALLISITAGFIVTRVTQEDSQDLGSDIGGQLLSKPKALLIGGAILFFFAMIPGFPKITFISLALLAGGTGFYLLRQEGASNIDVDMPDDMPAMAPASQAGQKTGAIEEADEFSMTVPLMIDVSIDCEAYLSRQQLNDELFRVRRALYLDLGVPFPGMHLRFNHQLMADEYVIMLHEIPIARGRFRPESLLVIGQQQSLSVLDVNQQADSKAFPAHQCHWVSMDQQAMLDRAAVSYLTPVQMLSYHLSLVLKKYSEDFIGIQETRYLMEKMEGKFSELTREAQRVVPLQKITEIFQRLVSEDISIRNLRAILESLVEWGPKEKDTVMLVEYIRGSLRRQISYKFSNGQNILPAYLLDHTTEDMIRNGIRQTSSGAYLALDPSTTNQFVLAVKQTVGNLGDMSSKPVLLASMDIRRYVRKLLEMEIYELSVLSHQELTQEITIQPLGKIGL